MGRSRRRTARRKKNERQRRIYSAQQQQRYKHKLKQQAENAADDTEARMCTGKHKYSSHMRASHNLPETQYIYRCPYCQQFHRATKDRHK